MYHLLWHKTIKKIYSVFRIARLVARQWLGLFSCHSTSILSPIAPCQSHCLQKRLRYFFWYGLLLYRPHYSLIDCFCTDPIILFITLIQLDVNTKPTNFRATFSFLSFGIRIPSFASRNWTLLTKYSFLALKIQHLNLGQKKIFDYIYFSFSTSLRFFLFYILTHSLHLHIYFNFTY